MAKYRNRRIAEELRKEISDIIRHMKDSRLALVSVLDVRVDSELSLAKVYISHYAEAGSDQTLEALRGAAGYIRSELARRLKTRTVPELRFVDDRSIEAGFKITEILLHGRELLVHDLAVETGEFRYLSSVEGLSGFLHGFQNDLSVTHRFTYAVRYGQTADGNRDGVL